MGSMAGWQRFLQLLQCSCLWQLGMGQLTMVARIGDLGFWTGVERLLQLANPVVLEVAWSYVDVGARWQHICQTCCKVDV